MQAEMPEDHSDAYRHIQRVLRAELRDFKAHVSCIHYILTNAGNFIAEDHGILSSRFRLECIKHHGTHCLLGTYDCISVFLEATDRVHRIVHMLPCDTVFRSEGRLMDLSRRRNRAYSAKPYLIYLE